MKIKKKKKKKKTKKVNHNQMKMEILLSRLKKNSMNMVMKFWLQNWMSKGMKFYHQMMKILNIISRKIINKKKNQNQKNRKKKNKKNSIN